MPLNVNKVCKFIAFNLLTHRDDKGLTWGNRKKEKEKRESLELRHKLNFKFTLVLYMC